MASSIVVQICSQIDPKLVPCFTQSTSVDTMPLGWPKKNGSTIFSDVSSCQPPNTMMNTASCASVHLQFPRRRHDRALLFPSGAPATSAAPDAAVRA